MVAVSTETRRDFSTKELQLIRKICGSSGMPTVLRVGRYRFHFFSNEGNESPHIHVKASGDEAKFWLDSVQLAANYGFNVREINEIERLVQEHRDALLEAWHEHFG